MSRFIIDASERVSLKQVGQKAANISFLMRKGFLVPESAFIPVKVCRAFLKECKIHGEIERLIHRVKSAEEGLNLKTELAQIRQKIVTHPLGSDFENALANLAQSWKTGGIEALAVRSSAVNEDRAGHSFAGQYHSELNVPLEASAIAHAVRKVWASLFSDAVWDYCQKNRLPLPAFEMGVILQRMVNAQFAGVAFSQNPAFPEKDELLIEYVAGIGDKLVDGRVTPEELVVKREKAEAGKPIDVTGKKKLPGIDEFIGELLRLERIVAEPVDVEWAFGDGRYFFLQFRPITTLKDVVIWTNENVGEVIPDVVTPFSWSVLKPMSNGAYRYFLRNVGLKLGQRELFTLYEGKVYFNQMAFRRVLQAFYLSTYLGKGERNPFRLLKNAFKLGYLLLRLSLFLQILPRRINRIQKRKVFKRKKVDLSGADSKRLLADIKGILADLQRLMNLHIATTIFAEIFYQILDKMCRENLKVPDIDASKLLQGIGEVESTRSTRSLWVLAKWIRQNPRYREKFLNQSPDEIARWVAGLPQGEPLKEGIDLFFEEYGHGALHEFEIIYPRWREDRSYIFRSLQAYVKKSEPEFDFARRLKSMEKERRKLRRQAIDSLKIPQKFLFGYLLKKAEYFSFEREILKQCLIMGFDRLKQNAVELNKRYFDDPQAIFYLRLDEIDQLVKNDGLKSGLLKQAAERKEERSRQMLVKHPDRLKQTGDRWIPLTEEEAPEGSLSGIPCSAGVAEGRVRVILQAERSGALQKGEILVTRATNPGWTPLMALAGGIITEIGGALSHGAIIAREFGIPMVAAVKDATGRLKDGQSIRINGQSGTIEILEKE
ncbi:MAG: hypothetical protein GXO77_02630 [Calditrichaeota bacterium]|nr:hypothetical protein [Calditrichota bacterium]